ncbi:MAG TPA: hypothetical protein VH352_28140 [Pseudonocardiaceae bacterium]|jgi:hypothetical protein|nr:hypothetical protein [Pseudonocardiaceae bacterium]
MDLWQTVRVLGRRWYVAVPAFLLALGIAGVVALHTPHKYESNGTYVLREPSAAESGGKAFDNPANPLLAFADSLTTDAQLLVQSVNSPDAIAEVQAGGGTATYVASNGGLQGPFVFVKADALTPDAAQATVTLAFKYVAQELRRRQQALGAPPATYVVLKEVVAPQQAAIQAGGKSRFAGVAAILALVACLTVTFVADGYLRRRAESKATSEPETV